MELLSASRGFLKCNFHCHTTCSDGRLSPKDVMAAYRALDYDVLAITDHREVTRPAADEIPAGLTLIPGTELDFLLPTQAVHLLGLGVSPDIADCWNPNGTPQQAIDSIRACGGRCAGASRLVAEHDGIDVLLPRAERRGNLQQRLLRAHKRLARGFRRHA